jgi:triacylglycerol esterase/lipase EstA (alpha/beta hydrolase family)
MITRITRTLLVVQLLIAIGIAVMLVKVFHVESPLIAMLGGLGAVLLVRMQIIANNFFLSSRYRSKVPHDRRLHWWQACKLFLVEYSASMTSSSFTMPFHAFGKRRAKDPLTLPVLLVHGYGCNSGYWHSMSKALVSARITHYAVNMEPLVCGIDDYVRQVHETVETMCRETGSGKVIIVAHSMGGLVTRAYLRDHGTARIAKAITLGSPHRGTGVARFGLGLNCRQMHWTPDGAEGESSEWLRRLAEGENEDIRHMLVSIYSLHDNIISPQTSSRVPGATNIEFFGIGHVALAFDPAVQARVIAEIQEASRQSVEQNNSTPTASRLS